MHGAPCVPALFAAHSGAVWKNVTRPSLDQGVKGSMSDPRNVAHDKKVKQEKEHEKPTEEVTNKTEAEPAAPAPGADEGPSDSEKSVAVLSKLKEMEFHSRANIETLAGLTLTIEDELKQKEFVDPLGELYGAQDAFQTKIAALIESYGAHLQKDSST